MLSCTVLSWLLEGFLVGLGWVVNEWLASFAERTFLITISGINCLQQPEGKESEIFSQLAVIGEYEAAVVFSHTCFSGPSLRSSLERALCSLASKCAVLQMNEDGKHIYLSGLPSPNSSFKI
jgi:hypothetical protein